jgi:hypothetical protein
MCLDLSHATWVMCLADLGRDLEIWARWSWSWSWERRAESSHSASRSAPLLSEHLQTKVCATKAARHSLEAHSTTPADGRKTRPLHSSYSRHTQCAAVPAAAWGPPPAGIAAGAGAGVGGAGAGGAGAGGTGAGSVGAPAGSVRVGVYGVPGSCAGITPGSRGCTPPAVL